MNKILVLFILILTLSQSDLVAKNYNQALGLRGMFDGGLTYKQFLDNTKAFEIVLHGGRKWFGVTGFYEWHNKTKHTQLEWYYGIGAHAVFIEDNKNTPWGRDSDDDIVLGLDGILGLEYALKEIPIVFSLDWNPTVNLIGDTGFWATRGSFSIRFYW